jgi:hypothetical protein
MTGGGVIFASSGRDECCAILMDSFKKRCEKAALDKDDAPAILLRDAVTDYRRELAKNTYETTMARLNDLLRKESLDCNLLTAYYFNGRQRVYTASLDVPYPNPESRPYWAMGIGKHVANYLMRSYDVTSMDCKLAVFVAIHVIREVKSAVQGCGGMTRIAIIDYKNEPVKLTQESIQEREQLAEKIFKVGTQIHARRACPCCARKENRRPPRGRRARRWA